MEQGARFKFEVNKTQICRWLGDFFLGLQQDDETSLMEARAQLNYHALVSLHCTILALPNCRDKMGTMSFGNSSRLHKMNDEETASTAAVVAAEEKKDRRKAVRIAGRSLFVGLVFAFLV